MKKLAATLALLALPGCAIADRSDKFGADLEIGIGGFLAYAIDLHIKASVGFSKTERPEEEQHGQVAQSGARPRGDRRGFL